MRVGVLRIVQTHFKDARISDHLVTEPPILYFGTPVVLISTTNEDGSVNLAPMSSAWWLGWRCVLGLASGSKTTENLLRTGECVLNLPSDRQTAMVDGLALTTGSDPVPEGKRRRGYRHERDKFGVAGVTAQASDLVDVPRVRECPIQLEAVLASEHEMAEDTPEWRGKTVILETRILRVHADRSVLCPGEPDRIDPDRWRPLIMSFQRFYGLAPTELAPSRLATVPESLYRTPDLDRLFRTPSP